MAPNARPHVVVLAPPPLGHLKPVCSFAAKLAALRPIDVTLLLPNGPNTFTLGSAEAARTLAAESPHPQGILRVVAFSEAHALTLERLSLAEKDAFTAVWGALIAEAPIKCSVTEVEYPAVARPSVVVSSSMQLALFPVIRSSVPAIPLYCFQPAAAAGMAQFMLPPHLGGLADDLVAPFTEDEQKDGRPYDITGKVIKTAGLPDMYDYELHPADTSMMGAKPGVFFYMANLNMRAMVTADGLVSANSPAFDSEETLASMKAWTDEAGRSIFNVGPLRPFRRGTTEYSEEVLASEVASVPGGVGNKVMTFLDDALKLRGKESVIYICLGSMFWPFTNPDHMWALIDTLDERRIPFILSHPTPFAKIPEHFQSRFGPDSGGTGLFVPFAPQQSVLAHPAISWFITHGGMGGAVDSITQGVPMIGWPFTGDQPSNIAYLVHTADVAFELVEARTGPWMNKPLLASGKTPKGTIEAFKTEIAEVLEEAFGEVGARKRRNAKRMQAELGKAWSDGGCAKEAFNAFADKHGL